MVLKKKSPISIPGWMTETHDGVFEIGITNDEKHSGTCCAYIGSETDKPTNFGNLMQEISPEEFSGKRLQMTAWAKSKLKSGTGNFWVRVDGDWKNAAFVGGFDNMFDRPIIGYTDWTQYQLVVEVPETSSNIAFGCFLNGSGALFIDDISLEAVGKDVPLTGRTPKPRPAKKAKNLNFEK